MESIRIWFYAMLVLVIIGTVGGGLLLYFLQSNHSIVYFNDTWLKNMTFIPKG